MENTKLLDQKVKDENEMTANVENMSLYQDNIVSEEEIHGYPTLDKFLYKIGYTNYHVLLIVGCCIFYFSQGAQIYSFNLLMPIFNNVLALNPTKHIILSSICYFGYAIGSFFVGMLTKSFNRRIPILVFISIYSLFSILVVLYQDFYWITICRFIIGFCVGILSSLYLSNLSEYLPIYYREITIGIVLCSYILGILFYVFSFKLLMPNYQNFNQWKIILVVISLPCVVSTIYSMFIIRDSARLLLNKDKFNDAITEIRRISIDTKYQFKTSDEEKLRKEVSVNKMKKIDFSLMILFTDKFIRLTIVNLVLMVVTSATYVSNFFSLPLILYKQQKNHSELFMEIILAQSVSIPAILLASLLATLPSLGRKYTISSGLLVCVIVAGFTSLFRSGVLVCCTLINFFVFASYFLSKVYLIESFPSKLRDQGMSVIFVTARIAESLSPSICELTFKWFEYGPIFWIACLCLMGTIASLLIPFETRGQAIDSKI